MRRLKRGEKVLDRYGTVHTVDRQEGNTVYLTTRKTDKISFQMGWIHRTKCYPLSRRTEREASRREKRGAADA